MSRRPTDGDVPPAKKRGSDRQLTKDDAEDDSDAEEEIDPNNFQRASEEVLKQRKIVKARRGGGAAMQTDSEQAKSGNPFSGVQLQPPSSNPFSGITLVAPSQAGSSAPESNATAPPSKAAAAGAQPAAHAASTEVQCSDNAALDEAAANKQSGATAQQAGDGEPDDKLVTSPAASGGFAALASSAPASGFGGFGAAAAGGTNVFSGGAAKQGVFSGGPFSFSATAPSSAATNGASGGFSFPALGGGAAKPAGEPASAAAAAGDTVRSIFGAPTGHMNAAAEQGGGETQAAAAVALGPAEDAKTGEEGEDNVFAGEGALFEFDAAKTWRERGKGEMKINVSKETGSARLVMRQKGNLRLLMNAALFPEMVVAKMEGGKAVTFACINGASQGAEGSVEAEGDAAQDAAAISDPAKLTTWAFRIKPQDKLEEFMACLLERKGGPHEKIEEAKAE